jgi:hypothetical protein
MHTVCGNRAGAQKEIIHKHMRSVSGIMMR